VDNLREYIHDGKGSVLDIESSMHWSPLHVSILFQISKANSTLLKILMKYAVAQGHVDMVKFLLDQGANSHQEDRNYTYVSCLNQDFGFY
jgi:hypothetical protein